MEKPEADRELDPKDQTKKESNEKKSVGELFGIQLSAPKGMKNTLRIFLLLVVGNFLLLFGLGKALGLF